MRRSTSKPNSPSYKQSFSLCRNPLHQPRRLPFASSRQMILSPSCRTRNLCIVPADVSSEVRRRTDMAQDRLALLWTLFEGGTTLCDLIVLNIGR